MLNPRNRRRDVPGPAGGTPNGLNLSDFDGDLRDERTLRTCFATQRGKCTAASFDGARDVAMRAFSDALFAEFGEEVSKEEQLVLRGKKKRLPGVVESPR
jgi:hypothetical protein